MGVTEVVLTPLWVFFSSFEPKAKRIAYGFLEVLLSSHLGDKGTPTDDYC